MLNSCTLPFLFYNVSFRNTGAHKDTEIGTFEVVSELLGPTYSRSKLAQKLDLYFVDSSIVPLMIQENYLRSRISYGIVPPFGEKSIDPMQAAFFAAESFSQSDIVDSLIHGYRFNFSWLLILYFFRPNQEYSLSPLQALLTCAIPGYYFHGGMQSRIEFSSWLGQNSKSGKNLRLLREIRAHMSLKTTAQKYELRLFQFPVMSYILLDMLKNGQVDEAIAFLDANDLLKEDFDEILEICLGTIYGSDSFSKIPTATKTAFTRQYNKMTHLLPYADDSNAPTRKISELPLSTIHDDEEYPQSASATADQAGEEGDDADSEKAASEGIDSLTKDRMIKMKTTTAKSKQPAASALKASKKNK